MNIKSVNSKYDFFIEKMLLISYFFHQFSFVFSGSSFARNISYVYKVTSMIMIVTFLLIVLCDGYYLLRGKYSIKEVCIYAILGILFLISFYHYRSVMVLANLFAVAAFKNIDVKKALWCYVYATAIGILINVILGFTTKYVGNITQIRYGTERIRYGLGFFYPSLGPFYYSSLVMIYILARERIKIFETIIIIAIGIFFFIFTDVKAGLGYVLLTLLLYYLTIYFDLNIIAKLFGQLTVICYPLLCILTISLSLLYSKSNLFISKINSIVSGRLRLAQNSITTFGIKLFGQDVPISNGDQYHVDSSFISMMLSHGLVILIICICFMTYFCYITYKQKNKALMIALFMIAVRATFDLGFMALQFSPVVILYMYVFNKYREENN